MLVTCQDTEHADEIAGLLTSNDLFAEEQVLTVHSNAASDAMEAKLAQVQEPDSPVRVIVQVSMLNEGWTYTTSPCLHRCVLLIPARSPSSSSAVAFVSPMVSTPVTSGWIHSTSSPIKLSCRR